MIPPTPRHMSKARASQSRLSRSAAMPRPGRAAVECSALVLKRSFAPSNAILAAVTSAIPERLSGRRNWPVRFDPSKGALLRSGVPF